MELRILLELPGEKGSARTLLAGFSYVNAVNDYIADFNTILLVAFFRVVEKSADFVQYLKELFFATGFLRL